MARFTRRVGWLTVMFGIGLVAGTGQAASLPEVAMAVVPEQPTPEDEIRVAVTGTWPNACVPTDPTVRMEGRTVVIATVAEGEICAQVVTDFRFEVGLGPLEAGRYTVELRHQRPNRDPETIATTRFNVVEEPLEDPCVYDRNGNGSIDDEELLAAIEDWVAGEIALSVLLELIEGWVDGGEVCPPESAHWREAHPDPRWTLS